MTLVAWIWIALSIVGAITFSALVWFAGPIISIGDSQPFDGFWLRFLIILIVWIIVVASVAYTIVRRRRAAAALEKALTEPVADETDAPILAEKMQDALSTLKKSSKSSASYLYDLPWYLIIGPPGAGKTTALVNSGLKFPLANDSTARAVQGVGGTRYCDWWFTDEAVLIDTAGRYTTQDSDAKTDRKSWLSFLAMLRANRPRQPINGVLVAISVEDILKLSTAEVNAHADAIRKRLAELNEELKVSFPVYAVFTKMDLIVGFTQYFADLDEAKRRLVWGATFQTADKKANNVGMVPAEIDLLVQRLAERMPERLQDEPDLRARAILFGFPAQMSAIKKPISDFLNRIFEPTRYQTTATLRGFYFTSGTQEGTPFDQVIGALQKSYGVESFGAAAFSGVGKSFFLHDMLAKVVFGEAGWVSTNMAAVRRSFFIRAAAFSLIGLATLAILGAWWMSYSRNAALIADTDRAVDSYAAAAGPLLKQDTVGDPDLRPVYERVDGLLNLPTGYATREAATPVSQTFGLSQRSRLEAASQSAYDTALERLMRPRLVLRLEQQIQKNITDPTFVYEALKVYLMLGRQGAERRQGSDRRVVRARLGGEYVSRRALPAGARPAARPSGRDARPRLRRDAENLAQRAARRAGAGHLGAHAGLRARLHAAQIRGAWRGDRGLDRFAARRPGHGAGLRSGQRRQPRYGPRSRVLHLSGVLSRASRSHADHRREDAEGAMGVGPVGRPERRQAAICEHDAGHHRPLRQGVRRGVECRPRQPARCARWWPTSPNISRSAPLRRRLRRSNRFFESIRDETALTRERKAPGERPGRGYGGERRADGGEPPRLDQRPGPRAGDEVAAQGGRSDAGGSRRLDRGQFQAVPGAARRRGRLAADRRAARQSQRTLSRLDPGGDQSRPGQTGDRPGSGAGRQLAQQRHAACRSRSRA